MTDATSQPSPKLPYVSSYITMRGKLRHAFRRNGRMAKVTHEPAPSIEQEEAAALRQARRQAAAEAAWPSRRAEFR